MISLLGKKVGMTQVFDDQGALIPVTVLVVEPNVVVGQRNQEKDGYSAVVLGAVEVKESKISKPYAGQFKEGVKPQRNILEVRDFDKECAVGDSIGVEVFSDFTHVDVIGTTKGKGTQGVMKRHNFKGGRATHGSKFHRENGSTGMAAYPSKVIKGTKMAGRMGNEKQTVQNLQIVKVDEEKKLLLVKGAVPGKRNGSVIIRKAKKR